MLYEVITLNSIGNFLSLKAINHNIPDRETIVKSDGRWVRKKSDWKSKFTDTLFEIFEKINGEILRKAGYS